MWIGRSSTAVVSDRPSRALWRLRNAKVSGTLGPRGVGRDATTLSHSQKHVGWLAQRKHIKHSAVHPWSAEFYCPIRWTAFDPSRLSAVPITPVYAYNSCAVLWPAHVDADTLSRGICEMAWSSFLPFKCALLRVSWIDLTMNKVFDCVQIVSSAFFTAFILNWRSFLNRKESFMG